MRMCLPHVRPAARGDFVTFYSRLMRTGLLPVRLEGLVRRVTGTRVARMRDGAREQPAQKERAVAKTIVGLFENHLHARQLVEQLRARNTGGEDISVVSPGAAAEDTAEGDRASGVAIGAGTGAAIGGLGGLLVGLGALAIPGIGPVLAAGPIAAALAGAGIGAAAGGVIGALTELGIPEEDAHVYAEGVRRGGTLVTVRADDEVADDIMALMVRHGAVDVDEHVTRWRQAGWPGFDPAAEPLATDDALRIGVLRTDEAARAMETEAKLGQPARVRAYHAPAGGRRRADAA